MSSPQHKPVAAPAFSQEELRTIEHPAELTEFDVICPGCEELRTIEHAFGITEFGEELCSFLSHGIAKAELMQADLKLHEFEEKESIINLLKEGRSLND